jgi:ribosomal protein S12 methylthiotransferase
MNAPRSFRQDLLNVGLVNLGCVRNTVDAQNILSRLKSKGFTVGAADQAHTVIVNTCSFIKDAKKESLDAIVELVALKKAGKIKQLIVAGCLAERYAMELAKEFPQVDAFVGSQRLEPAARQGDIRLTPPHHAYVKICESCFNACSFCIIPKLKGRFASRNMEAVLEDVRRLDREGVREINIVGQDITAYGLDLYREKRLAMLVRRIARGLRNVAWVRLLYAYPSHVTEELLDVMASEPKVCRYLDIPFQHVNDRILKMMARGTTYARTVQLVEKVRRKVPGIALRSAFIVGFPGETDKEFGELKRFLKDHPMERVGVFTYSPEEGTPAFDLPGRVPEKVKQERRRELMALQQGISLKLQQRHMGTVMDVLVEEAVPLRSGKIAYKGRTQYDAPDIDGAVSLHSARPLVIGDFVRARITQVRPYDLEGEAIDESA